MAVTSLNANVSWYPGIGVNGGLVQHPAPGALIEKTAPIPRGFYRFKCRIWTDTPFIYVFQRMNPDGTIQADAPGYPHQFVRSIPLRTDDYRIPPPAAGSLVGFFDLWTSEDDLYFMSDGAFFQIIVATAAHIGVNSPSPANVFAALALARFESGSPLR